MNSMTVKIGRPKKSDSMKRPVLNTCISNDSKKWLLDRRSSTGLSLGELIDELIIFMEDST